MLAAKLAISLIFTLPFFPVGGITPSSIVFSSSANPSVYGAPVTLAAAVAPATASGSVTFYDGATVLGIARLTGGQATFSAIFLPSGVRSLKAYYGGDANYAPSSSFTVSQTVNAAPGGGFQAAVTYGVVGGAPNSVAVGDFNNDGKADLVASFNGLSLLLGNGDGTFRAAVSLGSTGGSAAVGDFNGDGNADLAIAFNNSVRVLLGNGDGTFRSPVAYAAGIAVSFVAAGDFNGDGRTDLAVSSGGGVGVLLGNGDGTFQGAVNYGAGISPGSIAVGDFNGDGKADLAVTAANSVADVLLGNGDGTFRAAVSYGTGLYPESIVVGDFNGDGNADIATGNAVEDVSVLLGKGDGTFQTAINYSLEGYGFTVAAGDFNADGRTDLAVANSGGGNVSVMLGKGDGTFFPPEVNYATGTAPNSIAVGNFNGNGKTDLVTANSGGNDLSVLLAAASFPELLTVVSDGNFVPGQSGAKYTITVSNVGSAPTSGTVTVTDSIPSGITATAISGTGWTCVLTTLTCTRADPLATATSYPTITEFVTVGAVASGGVTNTVQVSGGAQTNIGNGTASDFITAFTPAQAAQAWSTLNAPSSASGAALLLTDGTIMVNQSCSGNWYRLTPDSFGSYVNGTWSTAASMQPGYGPDAFSSAVLADGRLVVIGGEFNNGTSNGCTAVWTNLGAIYDPLANSWTPLSAPQGWTQVGDAQNVVLPNGQFLLASLGKQLASLDPTTLTWTILNGTGKADGNDEEGWTLLPDGTVLTVDIFNGTQSERYLRSTDTWVSAGSTVAPLASNEEMGPQVLRPDGTVFVAGPTGHTSVYNVAAGTWAAGPDFPVSNGQQLYNDDGPASLLPSGNVIVPAFNTQSQFFFEFDGTHLNPVPAPPSDGCASLLLLPTGQVLCSAAPAAIYTPAGSPNPAWAPTVTTAPSLVQPGLTYAITGTQFNGLSQAVGFGDDYQGATNYPLVRITNTATGHVFYCRTHNHSTMGIATGSTPVSTRFDVPPSIETGPSTLVVVANGIPSAPWNLTVTATVSNVPPTASYTIPPNGGVSLQTTGTINSQLTVSYASIQTNGSVSSGTTNVSPAAFAIIGYRANGVLVSEAGVPASAPLQSGRLYAEVSGSVNTGVAMANPNGQDALIAYYFTDATGTDFGNGSFTLKANQQIAVFLNQAPFNLSASLSGSFTFTSSVSLGVIALRGLTNERGEFLMTTLPIAQVGTGSSGVVVLPHFADGGGWTTQVVLTNTSNAAENGSVQFFSQGSGSVAGSALSMTLAGGTTNSTFSYSVPSHASVRLVTAGTGANTQAGSVVITPTGGTSTPSAISIFSFINNGITVDQAGVSAQPLGSSFTAYIELSGSLGQIGSIQSGLAIANLSASPTPVTIALNNLDGTSAGFSQTITVPARGQIAKFAAELFPGLPSSFKGFAQVTATVTQQSTALPLAVTALRGRYNERGDFLITTTPPLNSASVPAASAIFPQIVSGGGYTTQFVLFGQAGSGQLFLVSQSGTVQPNSSLTVGP